MVRITKVTDLSGNVKENFMKSLMFAHPLEGWFGFMPKVGNSFTFEYDDNSGKCLCSSTVTDYTYEEENKMHVITTRNSIYYIKEIGEYDYWG